MNEHVVVVIAANAYASPPRVPRAREVPAAPSRSRVAPARELQAENVQRVLVFGAHPVGVHQIIAGVQGLAIQQ